MITTFATREDALRVCDRLVEERLAVCATMLPGAESIYPWKGKIERAGEILTILKTSAHAAARAAARLAELHPYETPEILTIPAGSWNDAYTQWLLEWTHPADRS
ncbi:MAG: divalent-cation tolerance protein CutA [Planctomycetes bacterium]|nr:divalent-cation tolerance protein CutA [Planctomycetota bacterium]